MRSLPLVAAGAVALASLSVVGLTTSTAHAAPGDTAYALNGSSLVRFDITDPADVTSTAITGVSAGETLTGLDVRPINGQLYTLGVNPTSGDATLYELHEQTGYAAAVGVVGLANLPDPATVRYGFDFVPTTDRLRVTVGDRNLRINPNTGVLTAVDSSISGATTTVDEVAYTNNTLLHGGISTLYTLDSTTDSLYLQNPNGGVETLVHAVTLNGGALDFSAAGGFDIAAGVDAPVSNAPVTSGSGYAVLAVGGVSRLYSIDLVTGAATAVGPIGAGTVPARGLALQRDIDEGYPAIGLNEPGTQLSRLSTATPGVASTQGVTGITAGETLAAVAWRPQTGQLFGLGVNATANNGTLYRVDPQTGAATVIGSAGVVAWVKSDGATEVDLPDPATTAYGFDFNPTVDRVRVTAGPDLNGRLNPLNGAPVDGNDGSGVVVPGVNPDGPPGVGLAAIAYTNGYGSSLTPGSATTTLYALESAVNQVLTINPPNNGTLTEPHSVTFGGTTLDFAKLAGLDIPEDVPGSAYAALSVGGTPGLYTIDLSNGVATSIGALTTGLRSIAVGQAGANRPVPPPPVAVPATLAKAGAAKQLKKVVDTGRVLTCPTGFLAASCSAKLTVTATYKVKVKGKTKVRSAVVGAVTVKTAKGASTRLKVTLSKKGQKLLKQRGKLAATVAIVAPTGALAANRTTTVKVTLTKKKL